MNIYLTTILLFSTLFLASCEAPTIDEVNNEIESNVTVPVGCVVKYAGEVHKSKIFYTICDDKKTITTSATERYTQQSGKTQTTHYRTTVNIAEK